MKTFLILYNFNRDIRNIMKYLLLILMLQPTVAKSETQTGIASWYGNNNKTRIYSSEKGLYAAHKTLKLGSKALVTVVRSNKSVVVTIVDRGPYKKGRIIDVNIQAAKQLDFFSKGITKVIVTPL